MTEAGQGHLERRHSGQQSLELAAHLVLRRVEHPDQRDVCANTGAACSAASLPMAPASRSRSGPAAGTSQVMHDVIVTPAQRGSPPMAGTVTAGPFGIIKDLRALHLSGPAGGR